MAKNSFQIRNLPEVFNPENTFFIGQVFNWLKWDNDLYCGCVSNKLLEIQVHGNILYWRFTPEGTESEVRQYLNLDVNLLEK